MMTHAFRQRHLDFVGVLLERGATLSHRSPVAEILLHLAALAGEKSILVILVKKGVGVNTKVEVNSEVGSETALHVAARNGQVEAARILIEK